MTEYVNSIPITGTNKNKKNLLNPIHLNQKKGLNGYNQNNSFHNYNRLNDESFNQQYESLIKLWNDLGVTKEFQDEFKKMFSLLTEEEKEICIHNEKKNIKKVRNAIKKLIKEISSREKNIQVLIKFNEIIGNEEENIDDSIIIDSVNILKKVRINSLNCVNNLIKVREITLFHKQNGKYNIKNMDPSYKYNENYLMKMKYDLNFLKNSNLSEYIEFANGDIDPFLICCSQKNKKRRYQDKIIIPINDDLLDEIKQAKYYIIQDLLFSNIPQDNNLELHKNLNTISLNNENNNLVNNSKLNNQSKILSPLKNGNNIKTRISNSLNQSSRDNSFIQNINMSRTLHKLKIKKGPQQYDLMFLNPKQELFHVKYRQLSSRENSSINYNFDNSNINNSNITKFYNNNKNDKQINSEIFEESDECETETNVKKLNLKNDKMTRDDFLKKLNEYKYKDEDNNENSLSIILKEKLKKLENEQEIENKNLEEIINNENEVQIKEKIKEKDSNDDDSEELDYDFSTKENDNEEENIDESEENDSNENNSILDESNIKDYHIEYFNDINELIEILRNKNYIDSIPQNLKDLFNLNDNKSFSPNKLMKGIYPKIIVSYSENEITGICIYSFFSLKKPIKILINHLSSINYSSDTNEYAYEIEGMIKFIKENIIYDIMEIKINSKKKLDKTLKRLFKKNLSFKITNKKLIHSYYDFEVDNDDEKVNKSNLFLSIKSSSIISYSPAKNDSSKNNDKYINLFQIYSILNENNETKVFKIKEQGDKGLIFQSAKLKQLKELFKKNITFSLQNLNLEIAKSYIKKNINENFNFKDIYNIQDENDLMTFNFIPSVRSGISVIIEQYLYNRIEDNIELLYDNTKECQVYLIPTYHKNIKVIIAEMNKEMNNKLINNPDNNIYEEFYNFYNKLNKGKCRKKVIFIPSFSIKSHLKASNIGNIENNISIYDNDKKSELYIVSVDEYYQIEWNFDRNNNNTSYNKPKDKDIIIKDSFLFGIFEIENENVSVIQLYIIKKEYWNKNDEFK